MTRQILNVVSVSGGKDSTAMLLLARERDIDVTPVFADTGHEHPQTYEYLDYLRAALSIDIRTVRSDFSKQIAAKRMFIARDQRVGRKAGKPIRWTNKAKRRALSALHPTGNPYLDLCLWKGRFPSRRAQFCTQFLKREPIDRFIAEAGAGAQAVISWQGVRADESAARRHLPERDVELGSWDPEPIGHLIYRPIIAWSIADVFGIHRRHGIKPNPLYQQGMGRVGCMPCINCAKAELRQIATRFPEEIDRVAQWERQVAAASKFGAATFFAGANGHHGQGSLSGRQPREIVAIANIRNTVEWSQTARGGRQFDLLSAIPVATCESAYGLCE